MDLNVDEYKSGHTVALGHYNTKLTEMLPPRSAKLLHLRGPAFPAQALDLSDALATETYKRRTMHGAILSKDPTAFRKRDKPESASSMVHHREKMKNLLGDMHQLKDPKDIDKSKKFTRSILFEKDQQDTMTLKDYQFQTLKPIEDFVRPDDQFSPRQTGYEHGHIRSLLKLDTYGPSGSRSISREREQGNLPRSPNVDRHLVVSPTTTLRLSPGNSVSESRGSTAGSTNYNGAFPSLASLRRDRENASVTQSGGWGVASNGGSCLLRRTAPAHLTTNEGGLGGTVGTGTGHFGQSVTSNASPELSSSGRYYNPGHAMALLGLDGLEKDRSAPHTRPNTGSSTVSRASQMSGARSTARASTAMSGMNRTGTSTNRTLTGVTPNKLQPPFPEQTFAGVAITADERLQGGDPFLRRKQYFKAHTLDLKTKKEDKGATLKEKKRAQAQQKVAEEERRRMKEFDDYLVLAKYNP